MKTFFAFLRPQGVPAAAVLVMALGPDTPVWAGFGQARFSPAADPRTHEPYTIAKDGFHGTSYELVGQYGTHVDPPARTPFPGWALETIQVLYAQRGVTATGHQRWTPKRPRAWTRKPTSCSTATIRSR